MKKLETFTGGHPISTNDFLWLQRATGQALSWMLKLFMPSGVSTAIIEGVQVTSDTSTVTVRDFGALSGWEDRPAGFIIHEGEVFEVVAGTVTAGSADDCSLELQELDPINGAGQEDAGYPTEVAYQSGGNRRVYVNRKLVLVANTDGIPLTGLSYCSNTAQAGTIVSFIPPAGSTLADYVDLGTGLGIERWRGWRILDEAEGRVLVGYKDGDADFGTIGNALGAKTVTLTANQSGVREHTHPIDVGGVSSGGTPTNVAGEDSGGTLIDTQGVQNVDGVGGRNGAQDALEAHNNIQPSLVVVHMIKL